MNFLSEAGRRRKILDHVAGFLVATICAVSFSLLLQGLCLAILSPKAPSSRDYVVYWATGQQLVHGANPYDSAALYRLEQCANAPTGKEIMYMRNPPWTLPLVYPLGFVGTRTGWFLWATILFAGFLLSVHLLWLLNGRPDNRRYLLGYSFAPALLCLLYGQSTVFALLGLVLFLRLHRTRPFLAGASLWMCAVKPHLLLPIAAVALAWMIAGRHWRVMGGAIAAVAANLAATYLIAPHAWTQYLVMAHTSEFDQAFIPCLSFLLGHWAGPRWAWIRYVPALTGSVWALAYFWRRRRTWDWNSDGSLVLLVSILAAPYSWIYDQIALIPAILHGAYVARSRYPLYVLALSSAFIEVVWLYTAWHPDAVHFWTIWLVPAWLVWYVATSKRAVQEEALIEETV